MPGGLLVTAPLPAPNLTTVKVYCGINSVKVAVTSRSAVMVTVHVPVPVHAPLQPSKKDPGNGVAVRVTEAALLNPAEQIEPQLMPAGLLLTVPLPLPDLDTVRLLNP